MGRITQADVVRAAIHQLSKRGGYTVDEYFAARGGRSLHAPGADVGATCAIGGVEQAIWNLTGEVVDPSTFSYVRYRLAQHVEPELVGDETPRQKLYAGVMKRLNAKARTLFPKIGDESIHTVEQVTFEGSKTVSRKRTLQVFDAVLADLEKSKAKASA